MLGQTSLIAVLDVIPMHAVLHRVVCIMSIVIVKSTKAKSSTTSRKQIINKHARTDDGTQTRRQAVSENCVFCFAVRLPFSWILAHTSSSLPCVQQHPQQRSVCISNHSKSSFCLVRPYWPEKKYETENPAFVLPHRQTVRQP